MIPTGLVGSRRTRTAIYTPGVNLMGVPRGNAQNVFFNGSMMHFGRGFPMNPRRVETRPYSRSLTYAYTRPRFRGNGYPMSQFDRVINNGRGERWLPRKLVLSKNLRKGKRGRFFTRRNRFQAAPSDTTGPKRNDSRRQLNPRFNKRVTEDSLNADLDAYMGSDNAKLRLDNQLDAYFGRIGPSTSDHKITQNVDPLNDPADITMDGANTTHYGRKSMTSAVNNSL